MACLPQVLGLSGKGDIGRLGSRACYKIVFEVFEVVPTMTWMCVLGHW